MTALHNIILGLHNVPLRKSAMILPGTFIILLPAGGVVLTTPSFYLRHDFAKLKHNSKCNWVKNCALIRSVAVHFNNSMMQQCIGCLHLGPVFERRNMSSLMQLLSTLNASFTPQPHSLRRCTCYDNNNCDAKLIIKSHSSKA